MEKIVQLTEAKNRFSEMVRMAEDQAVWVLRHGRPAVVLVNPAHYEELLNEIEDLRDRLSVIESRESSEDLRIPWAKVKAELDAD